MFKIISALDKAYFYRQLASLLATDLSVDDIFKILRKDLGNSYFEKTVKEVHEEVRRGVPIPDCFARQIKFFGGTVPQLLSICNKCNALKTAFFILARDEEWKRLKAKLLLSVLSWPLFYMIVITIMFNLFNKYLMPLYVEMFDSYWKELPVLTRFVHVFAENSLFLWLFIVFLVIMLLGKNHIRLFAVTIDCIILKLPIIGKFMKRMEASKFICNFSLLIESNVPVDKAFLASVQLMENCFLLKSFSEVKIDEPIHIVFRRIGIFPERIVHFVKIVEKIGVDEEMTRWLDRVYSDMYVELLFRIHGTMQLVLRCIIGLAVGIIVLSFYLPIFQFGIMF